MSTTNPDDTARAIRGRLRPAAGVVAILGILVGPVLFAINSASETRDENAWVIVAFVLISVAAGLFGYYVVRPTPWIIAAYCLAYGGGLFLVLSSGVPLGDSTSVIHQGFWIVAIPYLAAIVCVIMYLRRHAAVQVTRGRGVDTTATVVGAGVDGQVNYVQHQRLTLSFVDGSGTTRYFRTGITGGYYSIGDQLPIRYDPGHPDRVRAILVGGQPYVDPSQQP